MMILQRLFNIKYKTKRNKSTLFHSIFWQPISSFPRCSNDISFWLPENIGKFSSNAFYDLVRDQAGDLIEQVELIDNFTNAKTKRTSHCYRIAYRAMDRNLTQKEVNELHKVIEEKVVREYHVKIR